MAPDAAEFVVAHARVAGHPRCVCQLTLLVYQEQDVGLHAEDESRRRSTPPSSSPTDLLLQCVLRASRALSLTDLVILRRVPTIL